MVSCKAMEAGVAKQTGRRRKVKAQGLVFVTICCALALASCAASEWHHPRKSAAEAEADENTCNKLAEDAALTRARRQRADYRMPKPVTETGYYRGETSMQLADRGDTTKNFEKSLADCMTSKGYTQGSAQNGKP
jgi:hypothetical protein